MKTAPAILPKNLKILKAEIHQCKNAELNTKSILPGTIIRIFDDAIGVKAKNGVLKLLEVQLAGKQSQGVKQFMNGSGRNLVQVNKLLH